MRGCGARLGLFLVYRNCEGRGMRVLRALCFILLETWANFRESFAGGFCHRFK